MTSELESELVGPCIESVLACSALVSCDFMSPAREMIESVLTEGGTGLDFTLDCESVDPENTVCGC